MAYRYLEDIATADAAFEAVGRDLEEVFKSCADALMNVMVADLARIGKREEVEIREQHPELDMLLFNFLQELIYLKDARRLLLLVTSVAIEQGEEGFTLRATAGGEEIDPEKHDLIVDVKAVTLYRFDLRRTPDGWTAIVVVDI